MIYPNQAAAVTAAAIMNASHGFPPARAILTADGWTVIRSWAYA